MLFMTNLSNSMRIEPLLKLCSKIYFFKTNFFILINSVHFILKLLQSIFTVKKYFSQNTVLIDLLNFRNIEVIVSFCLLYFICRYNTYYFLIVVTV